jgi:hypothetical protein
MNRSRIKIRNILKREELKTVSYESEAAKIFIKFLREHPELNEDEVDMRINTWEEEEDHYGNGGGIFHSVEIYTTREETDEEYETRVVQEEQEIINKHTPIIRNAVYELRWDMNLRGKAEEGKRLYDAVVDIVKSVFNGYV